MGWRRSGASVCAALFALTAGCAGADYAEMPPTAPYEAEYDRGPEYADGSVGASPAPEPSSPPGNSMGFGRTLPAGGGERAEEAKAGWDGDELLAQAEPAPPPPGREGGERPPGRKPGDTAVEPGRSQPLLIYQATLHLAVFDVVPTQRAAIDLAKKLGGFLSAQTDQQVTIRIPARRFQDAVAAVEKLGDVLHRNVQALDVTEEFRDLTIRLRNAEVVRERLEQLLQKADKVEDALAVQRELASVTQTIEQLKGRLRFMEDRLAYSTITIVFQPRPREGPDEPEVFRLPFPWLDELGLRSLLNLR